jgi:hypothetical protein
MKKLLAILFVLMCNVGLFGQVTPIFPSRAVTDADMWVSSDMCSMRLAYPLGPTDTTIQVTTAVGCPTANFLIKIENEVIGISSVSGVVLSVAAGGRHYGGTTAAGHARGQIANMGYFSYQQNRDSAEIESLEAFLMTGTGTAAWGHILGTLTDQGDLVTALGGKQNALTDYATISELTGYPSFGGAALLNVGTTSGTVAAGNDSRFGSGGGSLPVVPFNPNTATTLTCPGTSGAQFVASTTLTGAASIPTISCAPTSGTAVTVRAVLTQGTTVYALTLPSPFNVWDFTKMAASDTMTCSGTYDGANLVDSSCGVKNGGGVQFPPTLLANVPLIPGWVGYASDATVSTCAGSGSGAWVFVDAAGAKHCPF